MKKIIKTIVKRLFCRHKYQPVSSCSNLDKNDNRYNTWYVFECRKCHKEKVFKTYGNDKILNAKKIS